MTGSDVSHGKRVGHWCFPPKSSSLVMAIEEAGAHICAPKKIFISHLLGFSEI
jgi:hypothetical protein